MNTGISSTVRCGKCGSTDIVQPINNADVIYQCRGCGHKKENPAPPGVSTWPTVYISSKWTGEIVF